MIFNLEEENDLIKRKDPKTIKKTYIIIASIIICLTIIDQLTKFVAQKVRLFRAFPRYFKLSYS